MGKSSIVTDPSIDGPAFKFGLGIDNQAMYYDKIPDVGSPASAWHLAQWHTANTLDPSFMATQLASETDSIFGLPAYSWTTSNHDLGLSVYGDKNDYKYRLTSRNGASYNDGSQNLFLENTSIINTASFDHPITFDAYEAITMASKGGLAQQVLNGFTVVFNAIGSAHYNSATPTQSVFLQAELSDSRGFIPFYQNITPTTSVFNIYGQDSLPFSATKNLYHINIDLNGVLKSFINNYIVALPASVPDGFSELQNWIVTSTYLGLETMTGGGASLDVQHVQLQVDLDKTYVESSKKLVTITPISTGIVQNARLPVGYISVGDGMTVTTGLSGINVSVGSSGVVLSHGPDVIYGGSGNTSVMAYGDGTLITGSTGALTVTGGGGRNTIVGGAGGLSYTGGTGFDTVIGAGHPLIATGGSGGGLFFGGGNANITAGIGGDLNVVIGGNGDKLYAAGSSAVLFGTSGGDVLMSSSESTAANVFFGASGTGHMTFITGAGNDSMALGQGLNNVTLGSGHVTIFGNGGSSSKSSINAGTGSLDMAFSGAETELNIAMSGARSFNLYAYAPERDHIHLQGFSANQAANAIANQQNVGGGTALILSDGSTISLVGVGHVDSRLFN